MWAQIELVSPGAGNLVDNVTIGFQRPRAPPSGARIELVALVKPCVPAPRSRVRRSTRRAARKEPNSLRAQCSANASPQRARHSGTPRQVRCRARRWRRRRRLSSAPLSPSVMRCGSARAKVARRAWLVDPPSLTGRDMTQLRFVNNAMPSRPRPERARVLAENPTLDKSANTVKY
jgi:hypothetical protein